MFGMAVLHERISVTSGSPKRLDAEETVTRMQVSVCNRGASPVFIGGADVTAAGGYELIPGDRFSVDLRPSDSGLWAVTSSGQTSTVHRVQVGWS